MQADIRDLMLGREPSFATQRHQRDGFATRAERAVPQVQTAGQDRLNAFADAAPLDSAQAQRSQRAVPATVVMPASRAHVQPPQQEPSSPLAPPPSAKVSSTQPDKIAVAPTAEYGAGALVIQEPPDNSAKAQGWINAPTISDPAALAGPQGAIATSEAFARGRKKTMFVGLLLLFGLGVVTTALGWAVMAGRAVPKVTPDSAPSQIAISQASAPTNPHLLTPIEPSAESLSPTKSAHGRHFRSAGSGRPTHADQKSTAEPNQQAASPTQPKKSSLSLPIQLNPIDPNAFSISIGTKNGASPSINLDSAAKPKRPSNVKNQSQSGRTK
jgi:hypothetical protein